MKRSTASPTGVPYYLRKVRTPLLDTFLKDEVDLLMKYEFSEVTIYKKVLEAIAFGKTTLKEIKDYIGAKHSDITPYLETSSTSYRVRRNPRGDVTTSRITSSPVP